MTFTCAPVLNVMGANSRLEDGNHILMWDFDGVPIHYVRIALLQAQEREHLPEIRIFKTSKFAHYQAWCYKRCSWWDTKRIIASTKNVDEGFYRFAVFRGHMTLRTSAKKGRDIKLVEVLHSNIKPDADEFDLLSWTRYETLAS